MKCPSCEMITDDTTYCNNCNTDMILYNKVHMMAARLYNKGLEKAQGRCLSGAIDNLSMCIRLQKNHIDARNLLGLIYWEVGEVGQAMKQWVISLSYQKTDNLAGSYLGIIQKQPSQLEKYRDTIESFNKSLHYIAGGSEDIGVISLRKAIAQNPNYIEAKALLSLYYITTDQVHKAEELLKEILKINKDYPKATRYWAALNLDNDAEKEEESASAKARQAPVRNLQPVAPKIAADLIQPKSLKGTILAFVFGAICMLGVYGILIVPSKTAALKEQIKITKENESKLYSELETTRQEQEQALKDLQAKNDLLEKTNQTLQDEQAIQAQILAFQDAQGLSQNGQWVESANKLYTVDKSSLQEDLKVQYDALVQNVYPKAADQLYRQGYNEYQKRAYPEAQQLLEKSYLYAKTEYFSDNALFILGRTYEDQGNMEKAQQYYKSVIENHPGTDSAYNAQRRIK